MLRMRYQKLIVLSDSRALGTQNLSLSRTGFYPTSPSLYVQNVELYGIWEALGKPLLTGSQARGFWHNFNAVFLFRKTE